MKKKKESFFWTSYSDLMTSLFFVILVLFVLSLVIVGKGNLELLKTKEKLEVNLKATNEQLKKIQELNQSIEKIDANYFVYDSQYKRHTLKNIQVKFKTGSANINDLSDEDKNKLSAAGKAIRTFMLKAQKEIPNAEYLLIIEGQSSKDNYPQNYELSYNRALALVKLWSRKGIYFDDLPCEVIISGSGQSSKFRVQPDIASNSANQRFVIHIIPKPGILGDLDLSDDVAFDLSSTNNFGNDSKDDEIEEDVACSNRIDSMLKMDINETGQGHLADWIPSIDSMNHLYVTVAETFWKYSYDIIDSEIVWSYFGGRYLIDRELSPMSVVWHDRCLKTLSDCYDNEYDSSPNQDEEEKAEIMLNEIILFFEEIGNGVPLTTEDIRIVTNIEYAFQLYNRLSEEIVRDRIFANKQSLNEMVSWNKLETYLCQFLNNSTLIEYYGGSIATIAATSTEIDIMKCRTEDLFRHRKTIICKTSSASIEEAKSLFFSALEKRCKTVDDKVEDLFMSSAYALDGLNNMQKEVHDSKRAIIRLVDEWLETRTNKEDNTIKFLEEITRLLK
jgi:hypothetical protein